MANSHDRSGGEVHDAAATDAAGRPTLLRALGPVVAMAVVVGNVIGSGIFLKPGNIAADAGQFPLILSVWVLGGGLCILGALCFAELATMLPRAGGLYVYLREAYGPLVAFLFGWSEFLFTRPASIGALAVAFVAKLILALRWQVGELAEVLMATVLIALLAWVNILGVVWGGRVQVVTTLVKATFLALLAASPLLLIPFVGQTIDVANYGSTVTPRQADLAGQIGAVLLAVMWAYNGWHGITPLAEEVRHPQRNIPLALFGGIGILIALYVAANVAYHGVLSMQQMSVAGQDAAERMLQQLVGPAGVAIMAAVIMCSVFGAINTNLLQAPRVSFAMGRDGVFFRALGQVHATYRTPAMAIFVKATMAVTLVATVAIAKQLVQNVDVQGFRWEMIRRVVYSLQNDSIFDLLTNFVIFSASIFYMLAVLAVIVLRRRRPHWERPYKTLGYPLVPLLFLAVYLWFLSRVYLTNPLESRTGIVLIALGVPVYYGYRRWAGGGSLSG